MNEENHLLMVCENPACNKRFVPSRKWQRFCSKQCQESTWKKRNLGLIINKIIANHEGRIIKLEKHLGVYDEEKQEQPNE